jgi:UDPglucose 6-dehydrogenase
MMVPYGVEAWVNVTEWKEFRSPDFDDIKFKLKSAVKFDDRNLYDPALVRGQGLEYLAIGR